MKEIYYSARKRTHEQYTHTLTTAVPNVAKRNQPFILKKRTSAGRISHAHFPHTCAVRWLFQPAIETPNTMQSADITSMIRPFFIRRLPFIRSVVASGLLSPRLR